MSITSGARTEIKRDEMIVNNKLLPNFINTKFVKQMKL